MELMSQGYPELSFELSIDEQNYIQTSIQAIIGKVSTYRVQILHQSQKSNPVTSFSHLFYLVIYEFAKKVEKSCHLGVMGYPLKFMY